MQLRSLHANRISKEARKGSEILFWQTHGKKFGKHKDGPDDADSKHVADMFDSANRCGGLDGL